MPKLAAIPKGFMNALCRDGTMTLREWVDLAAPLQLDGLEYYHGFLELADPARWPEARITGVDSSPAMIATARGKHPSWRWDVGDIAEWVHSGESYDLVFSNAALQWVGDHPTLFARLSAMLTPGGELAVQVVE